MYAILLHKSGQRMWEIQKGLLQENISVEGKIWKPLQELSAETFDTQLLLLAADPPDYEILHLMPHIRKQKYTLPVVLLDELENETARKNSLASGVDAYFSKPFNFCELATSLKKLVARKENENLNRWLRAYDVWLNIEQRLAKRCNQIIPLRNKEFSLLEFFIINRGKVLTRNTLLEYVWDRNANFASNTVDVHVNRLRRKLDDPFDEKLIHTIQCVGYVFDKRKRLSN